MKKEYPEFYKVNSKALFNPGKSRSNIVDLDDIYDEEEPEEIQKEEEQGEEDILNK